MIKLTRGKTTVIDSEDWERVKEFKWSAFHAGHNHATLFYAATTILDSAKRKRTVLLHRLLLPEAKMVDHIDRDGLNNRKSNLRAANHFINTNNAITPKTNSSGIKGVVHLSKSRRWIAYWNENGRKKKRSFTYGVRTGRSESSAKLEAIECRERMMKLKMDNLLDQLTNCIRETEQKQTE